MSNVFPEAGGLTARARRILARTTNVLTQAGVPGNDATTMLIERDRTGTTDEFGPAQSEAGARTQ